MCCQLFLSRRFHPVQLVSCLLIIINSLPVSSADVGKSIQNMYDRCNNNDNVLCSGIYGKNCVLRRSCMYVGFVADNGTHFDIILMNNIDNSRQPQAGIFGVAFNPYITLGRDKVQCKERLTLRDFRFYLIVNQTAVDDTDFARGTSRAEVEKPKLFYGTPCDRKSRINKDMDPNRPITHKRRNIGKNNLGNERVVRLFSTWTGTGDFEQDDLQLRFFQRYLEDPSNTRIQDEIFYTDAPRE